MNQVNKSIKCVINNCKHHSKDDYCRLSEIQVTTHEENPTKIECTDCGSFEMK